MQADSPEHHPLREAVILVLLCAGVALVVRWPLGHFPTLLPTDPNTPLHALAVAQLAEGGPWDRLLSMGWPEGIPLRLVGIPTLLLAAPLAGALGAMAALQVATTVSYVLHGVVVGLVVRSLGGTAAAGRGAALAALLVPSMVHVQSIGQIENVAPGFLALAVWGAARGGRSWGVAALGLLLAGFSTPYQAFAAGVLMMGVAGAQGRAALGKAAGVAAACAVAVVPYYLGAASGDAATLASSPPEQGPWAPAGLWDLLWPRAVWFSETLNLPGPLSRLADLDTVPTVASLVDYPWTTPHQVSYLGWTLGVFGVLGLLSIREQPLGKGLIAAAAACVICALGPSLRIFGEGAGVIPLPWALVAPLPGVGDLAATHRFLSGTLLALAIGTGFFVAHRPRFALFVPLALLVEATLIAPVHWPVPTAHPVGGELLEELPPHPVALWPPLGSRPPQDHELVTLILDRPAAVFSGEATAEDVSAWLATAEKSGARAVVRLPGGPGTLPDVLGSGGQPTLGAERCPSALCWHLLGPGD